ncbi:MAG TPA: alginate export family protein [Candidatus Angelobacter sp.]|nr:alginate export family protein [Candidatus Angelobacter sp.]
MLTLFFNVVCACGQSTSIADSPSPDRSYHLLREDEDWSFLADPKLRQDFWDPIKYIRLRHGRNDWFLTISGEAREVWEQTGNNNWGQQPYWNNFFLERYMLGFDAHFGKHVRTFVQFKSGLESFRIGGPRPIDEKKLDFQNAFLDLATAGDHNWLTLRVGIQELEYGAGRLIDVREGPNVRLSFIGFRLLNKVGSWRIDALAVRPRLDNFGFFDDYPNHQVEFWGVYGWRLLSRGVSIDAYYLGFNRAQASYERGTAPEQRQSLGIRFSRPIAEKERGWDFDYEGVWQFGSFGSAGLQAWTVASDTGYTVPTWRLKPRFSLKADISSGDNPRSNTLGTFYPLFPIGNYFGVIADTGPGPLNFRDLHPRVVTEWGHGVIVSADWIFYWRQSLQDGVYSVPGMLIRSSGNSNARFVGDRPGVEMRWQATRHLWFQADYGIFFAGQFLKQTEPGRNLNYWALWAGYKF